MNKVTLWLCCLSSQKDIESINLNGIVLYIWQTKPAARYNFIT